MKNIAIVGMGALGLLFGGEIVENFKGYASFVMDEDRVRRHKDDRYLINGREVSYPMETVESFHDRAGLADMILVGLKYPALKDTLEMIAPIVGEDTIFVSMMNGISSERIIEERFGRDLAVYTVAQGMDAQREGSRVTYSKHGELFIGIPQGSSKKLKARLQEVAELFDECQVPHTVEPDIMYRMWSKFMLNVGINQTCMVYDGGYAAVTEPGSEAYAINVAAMREVVAVGRAEGIDLGEKEVNQYLEIIATLDPNATPSMGQDRRQGRLSEVDMFAGEVIKLGKKHGIRVPANGYLYRRVHEIEEGYR